MINRLRILASNCSVNVQPLIHRLCGACESTHEQATLYKDILSQLRSEQDLLEKLRQAAVVCPDEAIRNTIEHEAVKLSKLLSDVEDSVSVIVTDQELNTLTTNNINIETADTESITMRSPEASCTHAAPGEQDAGESWERLSAESRRLKHAAAMRVGDIEESARLADLGVSGVKCLLRQAERCRTEADVGELCRHLAEYAGWGVGQITGSTVRNLAGLAGRLAETVAGVHAFELLDLVRRVIDVSGKGAEPMHQPIENKEMNRRGCARPRRSGSNGR